MTLFSPQADTKSLADLCHRLSMALEAGIDVRTVLAARPIGRTAASPPPGDVSHDIDRGEDLSAALAADRQLLSLDGVANWSSLGEKTGHLDAIFADWPRLQERIALHPVPCHH